MSGYIWPSVEEAIALLGLRITPARFVALFKIEGPALVSFSGGRTSALMLWCILVAHGGVLPTDVLVAFANTSKEREETLRFVFECASRWGVEVIWLERDGLEPGYVIVGYNSAARAGEVFDVLIDEKGFTPNRGAPFCSIELKTRVFRDYCKGALGWKRWASYIGFRADEGMRVLKALDRNASGKDPWRNAMPLADAGITRRIVKAFWAKQDFDLGLWDYQGNCDLCWKKSDSKIMRVIRDEPERATWWIAREVGTGTAFQTPSIADLAQAVRQQPMLPGIDDPDDDDDHDTSCDITCGYEEAEA